MFIFIVFTKLFSFDSCFWTACLSDSTVPLICKQWVSRYNYKYKWIILLNKARSQETKGPPPPGYSTLLADNERSQPHTINPSSSRQAILISPLKGKSHENRIISLKGCAEECSIDMGIQHWHGQAARKWTCRMDIDMDMQHGSFLAALTWTRSIDMNIQHRHGYAALTWTSSIDMDMQHRHGHASSCMIYEINSQRNIFRCIHD